MGLLEDGLAAHRAGKLNEAEAIYRRILGSNRRDFDALHMLGIVHAQRSQFEEASQQFRAALAVDGSFPPLLHNYGNALSQLGRYKEAIDSYDKAIALAPTYAPVHTDRGNAQDKLGLLQDALASFDKALALQPNDAEPHYNKAITLAKLGRKTDALASYDRTLALNPNHPEALANRGELLAGLGRFDEALASLDRAVSRNPNLAPAWLARAQILAALNRLPEALASSDKASALEPKLTEPWLVRASVLSATKRYDEALASLDRALAIDPNLARAWVGRGNVHLELKRHDEAVSAYDRALSLDPALKYVAGHRLYAKLNVCDWSNLAADTAQLLADVRAGRPAIAPLPLLCVPASPAEQLACARIFLSEEYPGLPAPVALPARAAGDRIRIAYVSTDFREHAVSYLMSGTFEQHDRARFQVAGFALCPDDGSKAQARLKQAFDRFVFVNDQSDAVIFRMMRDLAIDIAIDLTGYTNGLRPGIFALRPAPIQVNYLGHPATLGSPSHDYIVGDRIVIPDADREHYSEKVVQLPHSFHATDNKRAIAEAGSGRADFGLPAQGFVFCCFNASCKIGPDTFDRWMRIVKAVEGSILWLLGGNPVLEDNLRREAVARGLTPDRLVFARHLPLNQHQARLQFAGLFLDNLPFNAGTTASDALWSELPVLTIAGTTFAGRMAASILNAIGLPDLVAASGDDYERMAIELATQPGKLAAIKARLSQNRLTTPLFDTARFTRHLEAGFVAMHQRRLAGLPPDHIVVPAQ
jgi:predicted O-linked N-acetylglucosamine transferase (SPINDLY family)